MFLDWSLKTEEATIYIEY